MKNLKFLLIIAFAAFTFGTAQAQSVVVLNVGNNGPHHPPRERVIEHRRPAPRGRYIHRGRHYGHRTVYYRNSHRYYRYN